MSSGSCRRLGTGQRRGAAISDGERETVDCSDRVRKEETDRSEGLNNNDIGESGLL